MSTPPAALTAALTVALTPEDYDELDLILDDVRTRMDEAPQWEFCEGVMAALICCREPIPQRMYLALLLDLGMGDEAAEGDASYTPFAGEVQFMRFEMLWQRRWRQIQAALDTEVQSLDDPRAYYPEVWDVKGAWMSMPPESRELKEGQDAQDAQTVDDPMPAFGQVWALGFMYVVETWAEHWQAPKSKDDAQWLDESMQAIVALTEPDAHPPVLNLQDETGPPSISQQRLDAFLDAIWAVYDLRRLWRSLGRKVEPARKDATPGRNDPCFCGSGKKYKKCHGFG